MSFIHKDFLLNMHLIVVHVINEMIPGFPLIIIRDAVRLRSKIITD